MIQKSSLPVFHFLFTELIEETYTNYKQANYLQQLKRIGTQIGYRIFTHISIKKQINQRPSSIQILMKNIQTKVFKYLFNYQAANFYTAAIESESEQSPKEYYQVIEDNISIYLTWMPENLWDVSSFIAGIIESICLSSGLQCEVTASPEHSNNNTQSVLTKYLIKYSDIEAKKWNQKQ